MYSLNFIFENTCSCYREVPLTESLKLVNLVIGHFSSEFVITELLWCSGKTFIFKEHLWVLKLVSWAPSVRFLGSHNFHSFSLPPRANPSKNYNFFRVRDKYVVSGPMWLGKLIILFRLLVVSVHIQLTCSRSRSKQSIVCCCRWTDINTFELSMKPTCRWNLVFMRCTTHNTTDDTKIIYSKINTKNDAKLKNLFKNCSKILILSNVKNIQKCKVVRNIWKNKFPWLFSFFLENLFLKRFKYNSKIWKLQFYKI